MPTTRFAHSILTASGSNIDNPGRLLLQGASASPTAIMENATSSSCATASTATSATITLQSAGPKTSTTTGRFFAQVGRQEDPPTGDRWSVAPTSRRPSPSSRSSPITKAGDVTPPPHQKPPAPEPTFPCTYADLARPPLPAVSSWLAHWIDHQDNPYFARSYVNRLWGYLLGVGIIEPIDDIRNGNPPAIPDLLDYLAEEFIKSGFNVRHVVVHLHVPNVSLSIETGTWNADDRTGDYSHAIARRLPAEVLLDAVYRVTGTTSKFPGLPEETAPRPCLIPE